MTTKVTSGRSASSVAASSGLKNPGGATVKPVVTWQSSPITYSPVPILSGLRVLKRRTSAPRICQKGPHQSRLITFMNWYADGSIVSSKPYLIRTRVSSALPRLREFVRKAQMNSSPLEWIEPGPDAVGIVAQSTIAPRWLCRGERTTIKGRHAAFRLNEAAQPVVYSRGLSAIPFIAIPTTSGDIVLIDTRPRRLITDLKLDLLTESIALMTNYYRARQQGWTVANRYTGVVLPMVSHTMRWHHTDLVGAYGVGVKTARIGLAYEEAYLSLSEDGERPTFGSYDGRSGNDYVVDTPFLLTIVRPGVRLPIVSGWYDASAWLPCSR